MTCPSALARLAAATLTLAAASSHAIGVDDATGDFLPSYTGVHGGDLDVLGAFVTYNATTDRFVFSGTMDADIGTTAGAFYVFGVNRGSGTARLASIGDNHVLFDAVVVFNQDGSGAITRFAAGGNTSMALAGGAAVSDFAPDNNNLGVTNLSPVPEPATTLMLAAGLSALALGTRRRLAAALPG